MGRRMDQARLCRRGLHTIPAGLPSCVPCLRETQRRARAGARVTRHPLPAYAHLGRLPADDILIGAACHPGIAHLFDPAESKRFGTTNAASRARHGAAKAVCWECPVRAECLVDAVVNKRSGVYGGVVVTAGVPEKALVQDVPSVQDSSA